MANDLELLTATFDADITRFEKKMDALGVSFTRQIKAVDKGQADLQRKLSGWTLNFTGITGFQKALLGLTAAGIVGGIADLAKKSLDAAASIADIARQAGVSTDFLQKMRFAGSQTGVSFDSMDEALTALNKNFGDFVNTGGGRAAKTFNQLGIATEINSGQIRTAEQLFNAIIPKIAAYGSEAQKSALLAGAFGKEIGPKLLQLTDEGSEGIARLEAEAVSLGLVLNGNVIKGAKDANDKLDALFSVIKAEGVGAVAQLAPQIADLASQITKSLPDLLTYVKQWAAWFGLIQLSPVDKLNQAIANIQEQLADTDKAKASPFLNPLGIMSLNIDATKAALLDKLAALKKQVDSELAFQPVVATPENAKLAGGGTALHVALTPEQIAAQQRQKQFLAQTVLDAKTANAALIAAQDTTNVELLRGSSEYYNAVQKQINDEFTAKVAVYQAEADKQVEQTNKSVTNEQGRATAIANIEDALTDKVAAAAAERRRALDAAGPSGLIREALIQGQQQIQQYGDETAALGLTAGAIAKLTYVQQQLNEARQRSNVLTLDEVSVLLAEGDAVGVAAQKAHDAARATQDNIEFADQLRTGLEDIGAAGVKGFGNLKDVASQLLEQLAELIIKLYVMKPLVESLFGQQGTSLGGGSSGGGLFGSLGGIGSLFGFAGGGIMTGRGPLPLRKYAGGGVASSPQVAMFGEGSTPEAFVPVPNGAIPVQIRYPKAAAAAANSQPNRILVTVAASQDFDARVHDISDGSARKAVVNYDRQILPHRMAAFSTDPRRR